MFGNQRSKQVKAQIESLERERDQLNDSLLSTKNELAELRQKKKMEDEDMKHLVKLKESKLQLEFDRKTQGLTGGLRQLSNISQAQSNQINGLIRTNAVSSGDLIRNVFEGKTKKSTFLEELQSEINDWLPEL